MRKFSNHYCTQTILLFIVLISSNQLTAQIGSGCKELAEWTEPVKKEFPSQNFMNMVIGSKESERLIFNLYADEYFVPIFGKPYDEMSSFKKNMLYLRMRDCHNLKKYKIEYWQSGSLLYPLAKGTTGRYSEDNMNKVVKDMRTLIVKYHLLVKKINEGRVTFKELTAYKTSVKKDFDLLFPSYLLSIEKAIVAKEQEVASIELRNLLEKELSKPDSYELLKSIQQFPVTHAVLLKLYPAEEKEKLSHQLHEKTNAVLAALMREEQKWIDQFGTSLLDVDMINDFAKRLDERYAAFKTSPVVKETYTKLYQRKASLLRTHAEQLKNRVSLFTSISEFNAFEGMYFTNIENGSVSVGELSDFVLSKRAELQEAEAKKEMAQQQERRRQEDEKRMKEDEFQRKKAQAIQAVKEKRQKLRVKYETNLPTLSEMYEILTAYKKLITADKKYSRVDGDAFIQLVESKGYMRYNKSNISDIEDFSNSKGFKIVAGGIEMNMVFLKIPNAPQEIIELYRMELASEFRSVQRTQIEPEVLPDTSDYTYVGSGGTLYYIKVDDKGELSVHAVDNTQLNLRIITERISSSSLRVNSWSSYTDIFVRTGETIEFAASGFVTLGPWLGSTGPDGKNGYEMYSIAGDLNHGCLMGRIGKGDWFIIGSRAKITVEEGGRLELRVNDKDIGNNSGEFTVDYSIK